MPLIFISYDCKDSDVALRLAAALRGAGFRTWVYEEDSLPGQSYLEQVVYAILESDVVAIIISRESLRSVHVAKELFKGYESGKALLPILRGLNHAEFKVVSPEWDQALLTNVAISIPVDGVDVIVKRIVAGIEAMVRKRLDVSKVTTAEPTRVPEEKKTPDAGDTWAQMESRLLRFDDEIEQMRQRLERAWAELSRRFADAGEWRSLALERVKLADEVVREVLDYVIEKEEFTPRDYALIARGGYGRGFLSEGSDVDITLLFAEEIPDPAKPFWVRFEQTLTDVWAAVPCIKVSPLATSLASCARDWRRVFAGEDAARLALFVSFAYSRCLAGSGELHQRLRQEWRVVVKEGSAANVESLLTQLRERLQARAVDPTAKSFNLKKDAGGILEYRLTGFIEQFLSCRSVQFAPDDVELAKAHEFFLILRDHLHRLTRTPMMAASDVARMRAAMERETGELMSPDDLWNKVIRHRRRVRAAFKAAVEALAQAPREP